MASGDLRLSFPTVAVAWSSLAKSLSFMGVDSETGASVECSMTEDALTTLFPAEGDSVPELVNSFQRDRKLIEKIAALTYEAQNRRRPVVLRASDIKAALTAIRVVEQLGLSEQLRDPDETPKAGC